jgi:hypothetical protein
MVHELGVVLHACNPNTSERVRRRMEVEFEASLVSIVSSY